MFMCQALKWHIVQGEYHNVSFPDGNTMLPDPLYVWETGLKETAMLYILLNTYKLSRRVVLET